MFPFLKMLLLKAALKDQCVGFRGLFWQKWNIIHKYVFISVYSPENKNLVSLLAYNERFMSTYRGGPLPRSRHVALPCFYGRPERKTKHWL